METGAYTADFYSMTPAEIADIITLAMKKREFEERSRAVFAWHTAQLVGIAVNNPARFPRSPSDYFTFLDSKPDWVRAKENMAKLAQVHNLNFNP